MHLLCWQYNNCEQLERVAAWETIARRSIQNHALKCCERCNRCVLTLRGVLLRLEVNGARGHVLSSTSRREIRRPIGQRSRGAR